MFFGGDAALGHFPAEIQDDLLFPSNRLADWLDPGASRLDGLRRRLELLDGLLEGRGFRDARFLECRQLGRGGRGAVGEDPSGVGQLLVLRQLLDDVLGPAGGFGERLRGITSSDESRPGRRRRPSGLSSLFFVTSACFRSALSCSATRGISADSVLCQILTARQIVLSGSFGGGFQRLGSSLELGELARRTVPAAE